MDSEIDMKRESPDGLEEDAREFSDMVFGLISAGPMRKKRAEEMFTAGIMFRQGTLSQVLSGQSDHPAFKIVDEALDALEPYLAWNNT